jgi:outer membrane protein
MNDEINNMNEEMSQEMMQPGSFVSAESPAAGETPPVKGKTSVPWLLILNGILLVALLVLYIFYFTGKGNEGNTGMVNTVAKTNTGVLGVAFVNNDSILANYELVKKLKKELAAKGDRLSAEVAAKQAAFEKDAAYFQEQVQKKSISDQSAQEIYASLTENQQKIYDLRDRYAGELQQSEQEMNVALIDSVMNFLGRYNKKYKFDYILGFNKGGNILYANDTLDITNDVIRELNLEYTSRHPDK